MRSGWSCQNGRCWCLQAAGTQGHREGPQGSLSGEEPCGKWVIGLDSCTDGLVRSGSGAGGPRSGQVEPCNLHPAYDLVGILVMSWAWPLKEMWASRMQAGGSREMLPGCESHWPGRPAPLPPHSSVDLSVPDMNE